MSHNNITGSLPEQLYHGTDIKLFSFSDEGREDYFNSCKRIREFLLPLYKTLGTDTYYPLKNACLDNELIQSIEEADRSLLFQNMGDLQYQYGDLYLHSLLSVAWGFANKSFGGGELGTSTYYLILGAEALGYRIDKGLIEQIDQVKSFAEAPRQPALFVFPTKDLDIKFLKQDNGADLIPDTEYQLFRYTKPLDLYHYPHCYSLPSGIAPYRYGDEEDLARLIGLKVF